VRRPFFNAFQALCVSLAFRSCSYSDVRLRLYVPIANLPRPSMSDMHCTHCGRGISAFQIAVSWPTLIKCRSCLAMNGYQNSWLIGLIYIATAFAAVIAMNVFWSQFSNVNNGIHTTSGLQMASLVFGPALILLVVGPIYVRILRRFFRVRPGNQ
jgi:hypothetical protein